MTNEITNQMAEALEKLNQFDVNDFYACSISWGRAQLQGHAKRDTIKKYIALGYMFEVKPDWLECVKDGVTITLTFTN